MTLKYDDYPTWDEFPFDFDDVLILEHNACMEDDIGGADFIFENKSDLSSHEADFEPRFSDFDGLGPQFTAENDNGEGQVIWDSLGVIDDSYLVAAMGLQFLWSFGLATLDAYALLIKRGLRNPVLVSLFVVGDWVTATLSFAAACSTAGVAVLFDNDLGYCAQTHCRRYQISASLAFASWLLIGLSSLITFRLLATG